MPVSPPYINQDNSSGDGGPQQDSEDMGCVSRHHSSDHDDAASKPRCNSGWTSGLAGGPLPVGETQQDQIDNEHHIYAAPAEEEAAAPAAS